MIEIATFKQSDFDQIKLRPQDRLQENISDLVSLALHSHKVYTLRIKKTGKVAGILGWYKCWEGVAQVWMTISDEMRGHGLEFIGHLKMLLETESFRNKIRRVHAIVNRNAGENERFAKLIGFQKEFTMYHAAPDLGHVDGYVYWPKGG